MYNMESPMLVLTSVGSEQQAIAIAEELIQQELVACVNILPTMRSIYRFKGKVFDDEENLLFIKTTRELFQDVCDVISQMHTYEVPEIMGFNVDHFQNSFLNWVNEAVSGSRAISDQEIDH